MRKEQLELLREQTRLADARLEQERQQVKTLRKQVQDSQIYSKYINTFQRLKYHYSRVLAYLTSCYLINQAAFLIILLSINVAFSALNLYLTLQKFMTNKLLQWQQLLMKKLLGQPHH